MKYPNTDLKVVTCMLLSFIKFKRAGDSIFNAINPKKPNHRIENICMEFGEAYDSFFTLILDIAGIPMDRTVEDTKGYCRDYLLDEMSELRSEYEAYNFAVQLLQIGKRHELESEANTKGVP